MRIAQSIRTVFRRLIASTAVVSAVITVLSACTLPTEPPISPPAAPPVPPAVTQSGVAAPLRFSSSFTWGMSAATTAPALNDSDAPLSVVKDGGDFYAVYSNGIGTWKVLKGASLDALSPAYEFQTFSDAGKANGFTRPNSDDLYWTSGGIWVAPDGLWYTTVHIEFRYAGPNYAFPHFRRIGYATSSNRGITWQFRGDILTSDNSTNSVGDYAGSYFDFGVGDQQIYVDTVGGYFYLNYEKTWFDKKTNKRFEATAIARCPISAAMAPGCWRQWYRGAWTEPGLGGHASLIWPNVAVGAIFYSRYLKRFVCIGVILDDGSKSTAVIATATSLETQNWTPLDYFASVDNSSAFPNSLQVYLTPLDATTGTRTVDRSFRLYSSSNTALGPSNYRTVTFGTGASPAWIAPTQRYPSESVANGNDPWQWNSNPDGATNLALGKPASQSSSFSDSTAAGRAVDGNVSSDAVHGSIAQTRDDGTPNPWWEVDLGAVQSIGKINIYNRSDCCATLTNFSLFVSDAPFLSANPSTTVNQSGVKTYPVSGESQTVTSVNVNRSGRFVRIQLESARPLSLAEVQVLSPK